MMTGVDTDKLDEQINDSLEEMSHYAASSQDFTRAVANVKTLSEIKSSMKKDELAENDQLIKQAEIESQERIALENEKTERTHIAVGAGVTVGVSLLGAFREEFVALTSSAWKASQNFLRRLL